MSSSAVEREWKEGDLDQEDRAAFDALHKKYIEPLTRYCTRLLHNRQEGEQAAQDTFLLAWQNITQFRGDGPFDKWLKGIATNVCLKLLRTKKGADALRHESPDDPGTLARIEELQAEIFAQDPVATEVEKRLLGPKIYCRICECGQTAKRRWDALDLDIFELHYVQGVKSKREVARLLGENENKVKFRISSRIEPVIEKVHQEFETE